MQARQFDGRIPSPFIWGLLLLCANSATAQYVVSAKAGTIHQVVGPVFLDDLPVENSASGLPQVNGRNLLPQMMDGQRVRTGKALAEILLGPSIFLRLGDDTTVRMDDARLADTQFSVERGTALVEVVQLSKDSRIRVHVGPTVTEFVRPGLYRFEASRGALLVYAGEASVTDDPKKIQVKRGTEVNLADGLAVSEFDFQTSDALKQWAALRSITMFTSDNEALRHRSHWQYLDLGWLWNQDFSVKLFSMQAKLYYDLEKYQEAARQAEDKKNEAEFRKEDIAHLRADGKLRRQQP